MSVPVLIESMASTTNVLKSLFRQETIQLEVVEDIQRLLQRNASLCINRRKDHVYARRTLATTLEFRTNSQNRQTCGGARSRYLHFYSGLLCDLLWSDP